MRKLSRPELTRRALRTLSNRTKKVIEAHNPKAEAKRLWKSKNNRTFDEIREKLASMASGNDRCMYCEDSVGTDIEHFRPKATYPDKAFTWSNYLSACSRCNSNYKRDEFPTDNTGFPLLIDPTNDEDINEHLFFSPSTGKVIALSQKGDMSDRVFGLSRIELENGRAASWTAFEALIEKYARAKTNGDDIEAQRVEESIVNMPHSCIFIALVDAAMNDHTSTFVSDACVAAIHGYPEIQLWLR